MLWNVSAELTDKKIWKLAGIIKLHAVMLLGPFWDVKPVKPVFSRFYVRYPQFRFGFMFYSRNFTSIQTRQSRRRGIGNQRSGKMFPRERNICRHGSLCLSTVMCINCICTHLRLAHSHNSKNLHSTVNTTATDKQRVEAVRYRELLVPFSNTCLAANSFNPHKSEMMKTRTRQPKTVKSTNRKRIVKPVKGEKS